MNLINSLFGRFYLGKLANQSLYIHWSWWVLCVVVAVANPVFLPVVLAGFYLLALHELLRCCFLKSLGLECNTTLYLLAGIPDMPRLPPLTALAVWAVSAAPNVALVPVLWWLKELPPTNSFTFNTLLNHLLPINLGIIFIDALPCYYPLAGGRLLDSLLRWRPSVLTRLTETMCVLQGAWAIQNRLYLIACGSLYLCYMAEQQLYLSWWENIENEGTKPTSFQRTNTVVGGNEDQQ